MVDAYQIWVEACILYHVYIFCIMATKNKKITKPTVLLILLLIIFLLLPCVRFRPPPPLRDPNAHPTFFVRPIPPLAGPTLIKGPLHMIGQ